MKDASVEPRELELADQLRPRLLRISQALRRETAATSLTTAQSSVLSLLLLGTPLRVSDLARAEAVATPTMTQVINRMEEAGWVARTAPAGTYNNLVEITEAGRKVAREVADFRNAALLKRLGRLSPDEKDLLRAVLPLIDRMFEREPWRSDKTGTA